MESSSYFSHLKFDLWEILAFAFFMTIYCFDILLDDYIDLSISKYLDIDISSLPTPTQPFDGSSSPLPKNQKIKGAPEDYLVHYLKLSAIRSEAIYG